LANHEPYSCPAPGCNRSFATLNTLFQHIEKTDTPGHRPRSRWLIIDRKENRIYVTDKGPGFWTLDKLRETAKEDEPAAAPIEVPA